MAGTTGIAGAPQSPQQQQLQQQQQQQQAQQQQQFQQPQQLQVNPSTGFPSPYSGQPPGGDRKSTRLNSSHVEKSYAVFCLKKKRLHEPTKLSGTPREREDSNFVDIRSRVQNKLIGELDPKLDLANAAKVRQQVEDIFNSILDSENIVLTRTERARMFESIAADIMGFGPLETLLNDPEISEIMVNGPRQIFVERKGKLTKSDVIFNNDEHVLRVIDRIISPLGRRCDESSPMVDARLPDGSRVNAVIRPISLAGP